MITLASQKFRIREDFPISAEESKFIVLKYGELKYTATVSRAFGTKFYYKNHKRWFYTRKVSTEDIFQKRISASVRPIISAGFSSTSGLFSRPTMLMDNSST